MQLNRNTYGSQRRTCSDCDGEGTVLHEKDRCKKCKGKRTVSEKKRQEVLIKPGMSSGQKIVLKGEGDHRVCFFLRHASPLTHGSEYSIPNHPPVTLYSTFNANRINSSSAHTIIS